MSTSVPAECPQCQGQLKVTSEALGKQVRCPKCQNVFTLRRTPTQAPPYQNQAEEDWDDEDDYPVGRRETGNKNQTIVIAGIVLAVLAVGGVYLLVVPAIHQAREAARRSQDKSNLKMMGLAMHNYHDTQGCFPVLDDERQVGRFRQVPKQQQTKPQLSWRVHILPYLDHPSLYDRFHLDEPWDSPHNIQLIPLMPEVYKRPGSNLAEGKTVYVGFDGPGGLMENGGGIPMREIRDGLSYTLLVAEVKDEYAVTWTKPEDYQFDESDPAKHLGGFAGGFNALMGDGSVRFISENTAPQTLLALIRKDDGMAVGEF